MTQILIIGATCMSLGPFTITATDVIGPDIRYPLTVIPGYQLIDIVLPDDFTLTGYTWDGTNLNKVMETPSPIPVPESVSPRQIRQALTRANLRQQVEAAVAVSDQDTKDWYAYATEFLRDSEVVATLATALSVTSDQLDDLWRLAGSL